MRDYEERQRLSRLHLEEQKKKIYAALPQLHTIDEKLASVSVRQTRLLLEGDTHALEHLRDELTLLRQQRIELLSSAGYTPEDLEPTYICPDCKDTGYIGRERCHCLKQATIDLLYTQSNIRQILLAENFDTLSFRYYDDSTIDPSTGRTALLDAKRAVEACHAFVDSFDDTFCNLYLYGSTGVGKTFLSNCVAKALMDSGHSVLYFTSFQLFTILEESKFNKDISARAQQEDLFACDLLIIDDLGAELANRFSVSQLFLCLNERLLRKKSTVISSNLDLENLFETYSERNFSRIISNYTLLKLTGPDIRLKKKKEM